MKFGPDSIIIKFPNSKGYICDLRQNNNLCFLNKIETFDILGRKALAKEEYFNPLDVSHLKSGLLFIKIETGNNGILTKK